MIYDTLVVAGGTAGHVFPAIALATRKNHHLLLEIKSKKFYNYYDVSLLEVFYFNCNKNIISIISNIIGSIWFISKYKTVVLLGSFYCIPAFICSVLCGKKIVIYEQNAILGTANYIFSYFSSEIHTSFNIINQQEQYCFTGMPVIYKEYLPQEMKPFILVLSGSGGSNHICDYLHTIYNFAIKNHYKLYISSRNSEQIQKQFSKSIVRDFFPNFHSLLKLSSLVISHSGASTISFLNMYDKSAILIPLKNSSNNHQLYNSIFTGLPFIVPDTIENENKQLSLYLDNFLQDNNSCKSKWLFFKNNYITKI